MSNAGPEDDFPVFGTTLR